ncbi:hypothetical protein BD779DRAFT_1175813 [Infundibulicybe gibba]|nr:hypothetical protein BD779DRAFT_1175813 [Infundibulicybe gibba]
MFALQPPPGFVQLVLLSHEESPFYLEIPMDIMARLCLKPRKYLRYLGWCVLGTIGVLTDDKGEELELSGGILNQAIYHYVVPAQDALACAVDLEVIRQPPPDEDVPFVIPKADRDYGAKLQARDGRCVWTSITHAVGVPIIPHETGDEWLQLIIASRPQANDEGLDPALRTVDFQNGFYASADILVNWFAPRTVAVLKTPNPILDTADVPARYVRRIAEGLSYPTDARYTLQWLVPEDPFALPQISNNNDATFLDQQMPRPSDLLLHYNYGAAAVKNWGRNTDVLGQRPGLPRPHVLPPAAGRSRRWTPERRQIGMKMI